MTSGRSSGKEVAMTFLNSSRAQIKENRCACGKAIGLLGAVNIFLNGELHCFHYEVRSIGYTDSIVVGEEVVCKFLSKCSCNVAGYETSDRSRDTKRS